MENYQLQFCYGFARISIGRPTFIEQLPPASLRLKFDIQRRNGRDYEMYEKLNIALFFRRE